MGNKSDTPASLTQDDKVEWDHSMMKEITCRTNKDTNLTMMHAIFAMGSKKDYEDWVADQKRNPSVGCETSFNPVRHEFKQKGICGSGGVAEIEYECFPYMLLSQIFNRKTREYKHFQEDELWYLLQSMCQVGRIFHDRSLKVGDISPSNVFMSLDGNVALAHQFSWPGEKTNYQKSLFNHTITYLAPEQISELHIGRPEPTTDFRKSESFSVGLTMLDAAMLDTSKRLYDKQLDLDFDMLKGSKENLKNSSYSDGLKHVILNLIENEPKKRTSLSAMARWLQPYSQQIINFEKFNPLKYPPEVEETMRNNPITRRSFNPSHEEYFTPHDSKYHSKPPVGDPLLIQNQQRFSVQNQLQSRPPQEDYLPGINNFEQDPEKYQTPKFKPPEQKAIGAKQIHYIYRQTPVLAPNPHIPTQDRLVSFFSQFYSPDSQLNAPPPQIYNVHNPSRDIHRPTNMVSSRSQPDIPPYVSPSRRNLQLNFPAPTIKSVNTHQQLTSPQSPIYHMSLASPRQVSRVVRVQRKSEAAGLGSAGESNGLGSYSEGRNVQTDVVQSKKAESFDMPHISANVIQSTQQDEQDDIVKRLNEKIRKSKEGYPSFFS